MRRHFLIAPVLLLALTVADAAAQQQPAEPTAEQMVSRLRYQWEAVFIASIVNARSRGQGPVEFGTAIGHLFAPSWAQNLTPQGLARGMRGNFRLVGREAELLEDTPEQATVRFSRPDSTQFSTRHGVLGATLADYEEALTAIVQQIAADHGLVWDQRADGNWMVARVTRKQ